MQKTTIIMIINYYYKQHITHQQYKSGMCIYIYIYQMKKWVYILARSNPKKKLKLKMVWTLQLTNHYTLQINNMLHIKKFVHITHCN